MEKVNINTSDGDELQKIIHIGPIRAGEIIKLQVFSDRQFRDIFELSTILGLGPKRMKDIIDEGIATV